MNRYRVATLATTVALLAAAPEAHAQRADSTSMAPAPIAAPAAVSSGAAHSAVRAVPAAATREAGAVAVEEQLRAVRAREAGHAIAQAGSQRDGKVYMIVGAAAFVAGAVIGDDAGTIIMIGGAGVGLYGLYLYLQ